MTAVWKKQIELGMLEDSVQFDWTALGIDHATPEQATTQSAAILKAKASGVWVGNDGLRAVEQLSLEWGSPIKVKYFFQDGDVVKPGDVVCEWKGSAKTILTFERTFINLASFCSGVATATNSLVSTVQKSSLTNKPRITPTRKTLPGYRDLSIQATLLGGAYPHRYNLAGGVLIKENHIAAAGGIKAAVERVRKSAPHLHKIEIEVTNLQELGEAISAGAEVIMLDNFSPALVKEAILIKPKSGVVYEVSGGIHLGNLNDYLIEGVDVISVGSLTHSVKSLDLSLLMQK